MVICLYCGVLSQNAPASCSHIWRHLGLTFACGACRKFCVKTPKKLQEHLGKCKEALAAKAAADFAASQDGNNKEEKAIAGGTHLCHLITPLWRHQGTSAYLLVPTKDREAGPPCSTIEEAKPPYSTTSHVGDVYFVNFSHL